MKKLLTGILALALGVGMLWAADDVTIWGNASAITGTWTEFVVDTVTVTVGTNKTIEFRRPLFNVEVTSLNADADSGYVVVTPISNVFGIDHSNAVARALIAATVGDNSEDDTLKGYMGLNGLLLTPTQGGTADDDCTVQIKGVR